jgi:hypothetical protein
VEKGFQAFGCKRRTGLPMLVQELFVSGNTW